MSVQPREASRDQTISHLCGKEKLSSVLVSNGFPPSFVQKLTRTWKTAPRRDPETEFKSTAVGFAVCQRSVDTTLRSHLVRPKDTIDPAKQDGVSTKIPVNAEKSTLAKPRKIYTGEDQRAWQGYTTRPYLDLRRF